MGKTMNERQDKSALVKNYSRKDFLKGLGITAGVVAGTGTLIGCSSGEAQSSSKSWWLPASWDYEADVVVCGFGVAGGGAAYEALQNGASVVILEAAPEKRAGGASTAFVGYVGRFTHAARTLVASSLNTIKMADAKAIEEEGDRLISLLDEAGIAWVSKPDPAMSLINGAGMEFYRVFSQVVLKAGPEVHYETPAKELVVNPQTKEVLGVKAMSGEREIYVKANKGVVIATGSFVANRDLVNTYHLTPLVEYANDGSPYDNGDGLKMGMQVGANLSYMSMGLEWATWAYKAPSVDSDTAVRAMSYAELPASDGTIHPLGGVPVAQFSKLFVNRAGKRFINEFEEFNHDKSQLPFLKFKGKSAEMPNGYTNLPAFMVFDDAFFRAGPIGPHNLGMGWNGLRGTYNWSEDNSAEFEKGYILKADTLKDLAELMVSGDYTVDAAGLASTVETYNQYCAAGADAEFKRPIEYMQALGAGPYYAIEITPCAYYTIGGLASNIDSQTLDVSNEPIARLYSAGNVGQGTYTFPIGVSGCFGRGVLAGRHAASLTAWK